MNGRASAAQRRGYTLLEVVSAGVLVGIIVVPSLTLFRDSMQVSENVEVANAMASLGVGKLEDQLAAAVDNFVPVTVDGDFGAEDYPEVHFKSQRSDRAADGGVPGQLMAVTVNVWRDINGNNVQDVAEPSFLFASKVARSLGP